jgi:hypothetical protein
VVARSHAWHRTVAINVARRLPKGQANQAEFDEEEASVRSRGGRGTDLELTLESARRLEHIAELSAVSAEI